MLKYIVVKVRLIKKCVILIGTYYHKWKNMLK